MAPRAPQKRLKTKKRVFLVIGDPNGFPKKFSAIFGAGCRKVCCCSLNGAKWKIPPFLFILTLPIGTTSKN